MICWETITHFLGPSVLFGWVEWADRAEWTFYNQSAFRQTNFLKCSVCQMCRKSSSLTKQSICSTHDFKSNIYIHVGLSKLLQHTRTLVEHYQISQFCYWSSTKVKCVYQVFIICGTQLMLEVREISYVVTSCD